MADTDTHDDNDLLTDEERAAMNAEEGEEIDGSAALSDEGTQEWIDNGWGASDMSAGADPAPQDDPAPAETETAGQPDPAPQQQDSAPPVDLSQFDSQLDELRTQEQALLDQYDDGDLTREQFEEQRRALSDQANQLIEERAIAKQQVETENRRWQDAIGEYRSEYAALFDDKVVAAFDAEVRAVTSNPALSSKSFAQQLEIAHKRLLTTADAYGLGDAVPQLKGQEPAPQRRQTQQQQPSRDVRGDDLRTPPPTLANIPASDITDAGDSRYASLQRVIDNGSPEEAEAALAQLSPEERDRFSSMIV